ncbi:MAG TPA: hypothetical protein VHL57_07100 [Flavobacteriales bacterium]|jgi:ABC-type lipoprotein export system ATPase subunit|nr:hypothetical protein [Flavobacteriales bacterium]
MKTLLHRIMAVAALSTATLVGFAQEDDLTLPEDRLQEIKAQKTAFLTQRMDLTPEEAQKFWPVYNQYDKEIEAARKEMREGRRAMKKDTSLTEAEANAAIDRDLSGRQRELDIRKKYAAEFKKVIGAVKTLKLGKAEHDFNRELLRRISRDRKEEGRGAPHHRP